MTGEAYLRQPNNTGQADKDQDLMPHNTLERRNKYQLEWAARNREKVREIKRRYREKNAERIAAKSREHRRQNRERLDAAKRAWEKANPERVAAARAIRNIAKKHKALHRDLAWRYAITIKDYLDMVVKQEGRCAICATKQGDRQGSRLYLDHCHRTGFVRGLLCKRCNSTLGYMDDDSSRLRRAAEYIDSAALKERMLNASPANSDAAVANGVRPSPSGSPRRPSRHSARERRGPDFDAMALARLNGDRSDAGLLFER